MKNLGDVVKKISGHFKSHQWSVIFYIFIALIANFLRLQVPTEMPQDENHLVSFLFSILVFILLLGVDLAAAYLVSGMRLSFPVFRRFVAMPLFLISLLSGCLMFILAAQDNMQGEFNDKPLDLLVIGSVAFAIIWIALNFIAMISVLVWRSIKEISSRVEVKN